MTNKNKLLVHDIGVVINYSICSFVALYFLGVLDYFYSFIYSTPLDLSWKLVVFPSILLLLIFSSILCYEDHADWELPDFFYMVDIIKFNDRILRSENSDQMNLSDDVKLELINVRLDLKVQVEMNKFQKMLKIHTNDYSLKNWLSRQEYEGCRIVKQEDDYTLLSTIENPHACDRAYRIMLLQLSNSIDNYLKINPIKKTRVL